jgi:hypothetical protein
MHVFGKTGHEILPVWPTAFFEQLEHVNLMAFNNLFFLLKFCFIGCPTSIHFPIVKKTATYFIILKESCHSPKHKLAATRYLKTASTTTIAASKRKIKKP